MERIELKTCTKCEEILLVQDFYKRSNSSDGLRQVCKWCKSKASKERLLDPVVRDAHRARINARTQTPERKAAKREYDKLYREKNLEKIHERQVKWNQENHLRLSVKAKEYYAENKEVINKQKVDRRRTDINFRNAYALRNHLYKALQQGEAKPAVVSDLGCSISDFRIYIENLFYTHPDSGESMTWDNYGEKWSLDHVVALAIFNLENRQELLEAANWSNIQPLWTEDHKRKTKGDFKTIRDNRNKPSYSNTKEQ